MSRWTLLISVMILRDLPEQLVQCLYCFPSFHWNRRWIRHVVSLFHHLWRDLGCIVSKYCSIWTLKRQLTKSIKVWIFGSPVVAVFMPKSTWKVISFFTPGGKNNKSRSPSLEKLGDEPFLLGQKAYLLRASFAVSFREGVENFHWSSEQWHSIILIGW